MAGRGNRRGVVALIALSLATFTYVTAETLPIGLLRAMSEDLGASEPAIGVLVSIYAVVVVVASVPLTVATRRLPRKAVVAVLLAVFVAATVVGCLVSSYGLLLASRVVVALSQALFWSVITPAAAGLFEEDVRGRALSVLYGSSALAAVAGVPAGTWTGQLANWRVAFLVISGLGLLALATVLLVMPSTPAGESSADHGSQPDARRYSALVVATALSVTGAFTAFTYVTPFLIDISGFPASTVAVVLLVRGLAGILGVALTGAVVDRNPWLTMVVLVAAQTVALTLQFTAGSSPVPAAATIAVSGLTLAAFSSVLGARVLVVAPGASDVAAAGASTAFNVGIFLGSLLGGLLLAGSGPRSTALVGAAFSIAGLAVLLAEPRLASRRRPTVQDTPLEPGDAMRFGADRS